MDGIRSELARLAEVEEDLVAKNGHYLMEQGNSSPRGVTDDGSFQQQQQQLTEQEFSTGETNEKESRASVDTIQRYEQARDLYLQRRLENLIVDHVSTYNPDAEDFSKALDLPIPPSDEEIEDLQTRHSTVLNTLVSQLGGIDSQVHKLKGVHMAIASRRKELELMMDDLEKENDNKQTLQDDDDEIMKEENDDEEVQEEELSREQERINALQETRSQLREQLLQLERETQEARDKAQVSEKQLEELRSQTEGSAILPNDTDASKNQSQQKIQELKEIKTFYDSLRGVVEELGGVKISAVHEDKVRRHLSLSLLFYDEFSVEVELQVYRNTFLQLVDARWISDPVVHLPSEEGGKDSNAFSLKISPLDDLLQIAKSTLTPPHDLRFFVRETLARIRILQERVQDLNMLRQQVLTKIHNGNQIVCSLNDGIIVVMKMYERYVRVEQIIGVSGWTEANTQRIHDAIPMDEMYNPMTATQVFQYVHDEIEHLKSGGINPRTPRFPVRKGTFE